MGTDSLTTEQIAAAQTKQIAELQAQLARLHERLGPDPDAALPKADGFPKIVYRPQDDPDPKQLDHPGWHAKTVADADALAAALADGWQTEIGAFVYPEVEEQVAVVRKVTAAKKK